MHDLGDAMKTAQVIFCFVFGHSKIPASRLFVQMAPMDTKKQDSVAGKHGFDVATARVVMSALVGNKWKCPRLAGGRSLPSGIWRIRGA